ncbi:MAG: hypothetical protein B9S32_04920 [Verrucomicrobia bacterium Tous-C9LFEB]|nr:MAG: hypothetical protein B9S32_04920 [Verrucomicrobia bacterium Tous-C9LFEB]
MPIPVQTLGVIADKIGVSTMSVSRALSNKAGVSRELRERILRVARELGYRPNPLIGALMANVRAKSRDPVRTGTVLAFVSRADRASDVRFEHFRGAATAAEEQGYKLEKFIVGKSGYTPERLSEILYARHILGVLISPLATGHGHYDLDWGKFSTVVIEYTFTEPAFDRVVHDNYAAMKLILDRCRERGHRRIGLIFTTNALERTKGLYEAAYWMEQKTTRAFTALPPLRLEAWDKAQVTRWFDQYRPQVLITSASLIQDCGDFLRRRKQVIPRDCALVNVNVARDTDIGGIRQDNELIGATAVRLLIDKINRNDRGIPDRPCTVLTPGLWVAGKTF